MAGFMKKNGVWAICFVVFCIVVAVMTFYSPEERDAAANEEEKEQTKDVEEEAVEEEKDESEERSHGQPESEESEEGEGAAVEDEAGEIEAVAYEPGMEQNTKLTLGMAHEYLNELTGWGRLKDIDVTMLSRDADWVRLKGQLDYLYESFGASKAKEDVRTALMLAEVAEVSGDREALRFLHRVVHDLDVNINEADGDHWGITEAFGYEGQSESVKRYLEGFE
ncbi:hypothetical protein JSY36_04640 [Bacillus sp. H-16]|uniref:hypothetical protein n=1 Tax=Alteribacter salitolerans TaxID=2912333 RepID=UPI001962E2E3|nr:hypothetical protein [Alteribacter salitolerans]MBM7095039.1 hypothetical protein [Alteribacter salitolerans]